MSAEDRNIRALAESARQERSRLDALQKLVDHLQSVVTMQVEELRQLRQLVAAALSRGHGPSVTS